MAIDQQVLDVVRSAEHWAELAARRLQEIRRLAGRPDPRWHGHVTDQADLVALVEGWRVGEAVPEPVSEVLGVTRSLIIESYSTYEYSMLAATWGLMLIEASLRGCMPVSGSGRDMRSFPHQRHRCRGAGTLVRDEADALRGAARLRNLVVHGHLRPKPSSDSYTPRDALDLLSAIHDAISDIYSRAASTQVRGHIA